MIRITNAAWQKIMTAVHFSDQEVAWFSHTVADPTAAGISLILDDILIPPQYVGGAHAEVEPEQLDWMFQHLVERGVTDITNWTKVFCHSHVSMGTGPSSTDTEALKELAEQDKDGWIISAIFNTKGEVTANVSYVSPMTGYRIREEVEVDIEGTSDPELLGVIAAITERVKKDNRQTTYVNSKKQVEKSGVPSTTKQWWQTTSNHETKEHSEAWDQYMANGWHSLDSEQISLVMDILEDRRFHAEEEDDDVAADRYDRQITNGLELMMGGSQSYQPVGAALQAQSYLDEEYMYGG